MFSLLALTLFICTLALVIWSLVDVVRMPNDASFKAGTQIVWVLVILLGGMIGAIVYLVVGRPPGWRNRCAATPCDRCTAPTAARWDRVALLR